MESLQDRQSMRTLVSREDNKLWENTEGEIYLNKLAHQKTTLERAVPYMVVVLSILMLIVFPLSISNSFATGTLLLINYYNTIQYTYVFVCRGPSPLDSPFSCIFRCILFVWCPESW